MVLTGAFNKTLDVWSFGCLVFELNAGHPLFCIPRCDDADDDHVLSLTLALGPLPEELFQHWQRYSLYFTPERQLYNCEIGGVREGREPLMLEQTSMEELFDRVSLEIDEKEAHTIKKLIRRILQYDPAKRHSPAELLLDPWFRDIEVGGSPFNSE